MKDNLLVFSNCFGNSRLNEWNNSGGTLLGNKSIGCGINTLCFLGIFTKELGEHLVRNILPNGTTFLEMIYYLNELNGSTTIYTEHVYNITTVNDITNILNLIYQTMPDNSCTIVKLNRSTNMLGHTLVFSKENNILYTIDPQAMKKWKRTDESSDLNIFTAWNAESYISLSLVFDSETVSKHRSSILNKTYIIANFPKVNNIKILQWEITDNQISGWKCLSSSPGEKNDCALNSLSFLNVIERRYAKMLSISANKNEKPLSIEKIRNKLNEIKENKTFIIFKNFNNIQDVVLALNNELQNSFGTLLLFYDSNTKIGHVVIIRKIGTYNYNIIDTQSGNIYFNINDFSNAYIFNGVILVYNAGLIKSTTVTRKFRSSIRRSNVTMRKTLKTPTLIPHNIKVQKHILTKTEQRKRQREQTIEEKRKGFSSKKTKSFEFTPPNIINAPINLSLYTPNTHLQTISTLSSPTEKMDIIN